jgi:hypothetical protein
MTAAHLVRLHFINHILANDSHLAVRAAPFRVLNDFGFPLPLDDSLLVGYNANLVAH